MRLEFVLGAPISLLAVSAVVVGLIVAEGAREVNVRDRHLLQIPGRYSFFGGLRWPKYESVRLLLKMK
jgi:hypothetical protein